MELFGRQAETTTLDELLERATDGSGSGLVLWGEPGIGKTALLEYAVERSAQATVLRCRGTQMEAGLAYAALHELLWPAIDRLETLAAPQAAALRGALGISADPTNRFLVGAAVLSLVSELARETPVLVVVDDAQWIDEASAHCLGFLARRVMAEPVVVLATGHEDPASGAWEGLPALHVTGLADDAARQLVTSEVPDADQALLDRTIAAAAGNPLALHELPTIRHEPEAPAPLVMSGESTPVGPRLKQAFRARAAAMTPPARQLLLLAATEELGDRNVVQRAAAGSGVDTTSWDEVWRSGLIRATGDRLEFRHPLIRSAVYEGTPFLQRQAAHRALAAALPSDATAERAWHLAAAADGPDEDVAKLLERAAEQCLERSAGPMAARTLRKAAQLSPEPEAAGRRLATAARAAWEAGDAEGARQLLQDAENLCGELAVVRMSGGLRGVLEFVYGMPERAHHYLVHDMNQVPETSRTLELGTLAMRAAWSAGRPDLQLEALRQVRAVDVDEDPELSPLMPVLRNWWAGYDEDGQDTPERQEIPSDVVTRLSAAAWELLPPVVLMQAWGIESGLLDVLRVQAVQVRRRHELSALTLVLAQTAALDLFAGRWDAAENAASEGLLLAQEVGAAHMGTQCYLILAGLASARGQEDTVTELTTDVLKISMPRGVRALSAAAYWYRGRAALFAGRAQEALSQLLCLSEPGHGAYDRPIALFAAADTIEAALQTGNTAVAEAQLQLLQAWAQRSGARWARVAEQRSRALVEGGAQTEELFQAALKEGDPFEQARTLLLYGEWLRRARRRADARIQLAWAADLFERLGAEPLRARALREQDLADGPTVRRGPDSSAGLTAQELRVALLAAQRLTNREIAAQLLISPRTVGHHLANIYPKLGITSRAELSRIDFDGDLRLTPPAEPTGP